MPWGQKGRALARQTARARTLQGPLGRPQLKPLPERDVKHFQDTVSRLRQNPSRSRATQKTVLDHLFPSSGHFKSSEELKQWEGTEAQQQKQGEDTIIQREERASSEVGHLPNFRSSHPLRDDASRSQEANPGQSTTKVTSTFTSTDYGAVVVVRAASSSLHPSDFRRLIPNGKHIPGWKRHGGLQKVVLARDPHTFEPSSYWILAFTTFEDARKYKLRLWNLHKLVQEHTPSPGSTVLYTTPGEILRGEDVFARLQEYAIYPPTQRPQISINSPPFSPSIKLTLDQHEAWTQPASTDTSGGKSDGEPIFPVRFWVDGPQSLRLSMGMIDDFISEDEDQRNLQWQIRRGDSQPITALSPLGSEPVEVGRDTTAKMWMIKFADEVDARRFVRTWHRQPFPGWEESEAVLHLECLW